MNSLQVALNILFCYITSYIDLLRVVTHYVLYSSLVNIVCNFSGDAGLLPQILPCAPRAEGQTHGGTRRNRHCRLQWEAPYRYSSVQKHHRGIAQRRVEPVYQGGRGPTRGGSGEVLAA